MSLIILQYNQALFFTRDQRLFYKKTLYPYLIYFSLLFIWLMS